MNPAKYLAVLSFAIALGLAVLGSAHAQDAFVGRWALDPASTKAAPGLAPTSATMEVTAAGGGRFQSVSEVAIAGVNARSEVTYSIDGQDYPVTSTPAQPGAPAVTQSMERVSDTVYKSSIKAGGQVIATALNELSSDGNTLTATTTGIGQFAALSSTMVFRRQ
jgi:hypothetical protein